MHIFFQIMTHSKMNNLQEDQINILKQLEELKEQMSYLKQLLNLSFSNKYSQDFTDISGDIEKVKYKLIQYA